jgi:TetR/AcrR family transcriptional repressor of mexJK operon
MATRGRPKSDQKRQQILIAAADFFTTQGYASTSLEQVAEAAKVSKQTIYSHFEGKADVLKAAIKQRCLEGDVTVEQFDLSLPPTEFLPEFADRFLKLVLDDTPLAMYRLCLNEGQRHPELGTSFFDSGPKLVTQALAAYLMEAHQRQELEVADPKVAAAQFIFMVKGFPVDSSLLNLDFASLDFSTGYYVDQCCAMFLRAYAAPLPR